MAPAFPDRFRRLTQAPPLRYFNAIALAPAMLDNTGDLTELGFEATVPFMLLYAHPVWLTRSSPSDDNAPPGSVRGGHNGHNWP
jgi:hypothetical protein